MFRTPGSSQPTRAPRQMAKLAVVAASLAIALVACGSGEDATPVTTTKPALSKADFISQADALCGAATKKMDAVPLPSGDPASGTLSDEDLAITATALRSMDEIETAMRADLVALDPPSSFAAKWDTSMAGLQDRLDAGERAADAAEAKDQAALVSAFKAYDAAGDAGRAPLKGYGFKVCGG